MFILMVQAKLHGPWTPVGPSEGFSLMSILNAFFRAMKRPVNGLVGAKVMREDGTVHHVIL